MASLNIFQVGNTVPEVVTLCAFIPTAKFVSEDDYHPFPSSSFPSSSERSQWHTLPLYFIRILIRLVVKWTLIIEISFRAISQIIPNLSLRIWQNLPRWRIGSKLIKSTHNFSLYNRRLGYFLEDVVLNMCLMALGLSVSF